MNSPANITTIYYRVFAALMALLLATIGAAYLHLGVFSLSIAMVIAVLKAALVVIFFMHAKYSERMVWVFAGAGFFWLLMGLALTLTDYLGRGY